MATLRSESAAKARSGNGEIRLATDDSIIENKIDHFGVLAQIIDHGVIDYFKKLPDGSELEMATSLNQLAGTLRGDVSDTVIQTLLSDEFTTHFDNLHNSQLSRHEIGASRWDDVLLSIVAGTTTFMHTFSHIFSLIQRHYDLDTAAHPGNWRIADRLAKLELHQMSAYYTTYVENFRHWPAMIEHLAQSDEGGVKFRAGFPDNALVTVPASKLSNPDDYYSDPDLAPNQVFVTAKIKDMDKSEGIGCPVTFSPEVIRGLWSLYAHHAHRILTTPATGGSEAFHQQTVGRSQQLYRRLAQSMPSAHSEPQIHRSGH